VTLILSSSLSYPHLHFFTQTLTTLNLYNNQIGAVGAENALEGVKTVGTICCFFVRSKRFGALNLSEEGAVAGI
jgi:hypothetical protein